jgi:magnesium-transporting ATPase (P-type)
MVYLTTDFIENLFRTDEGDITRHMFMLTGYFAFFVFAAVFNAFNARTEKMNVLNSISKNKGFFQVIGLIVVVQVLMTYFGGAIFNSYGLSPTEWAIVLISAFIIIPVDLLRKLIVRAIDKKS